MYITAGLTTELKSLPGISGDKAKLAEFGDGRL